METSAPTVTTPVPPTPVTSRLNGPCQPCGAGRGRAAAARRSACGSMAASAALRKAPPRTETKLGQKPLAQE